MRAVVALKPFPYSHDGQTTRDIVKDEEFDCREDIVQGLIDEKYVREAGLIGKIKSAAGAGKSSAKDAAELAARQAAADEAAHLADQAEKEAEAAQLEALTAPDATKAQAEESAAKFAEIARTARIRAEELRAALV